MKRSLVVSSLILSLISASSFAMTIHGGKLLEHKEGMTGPGKAHGFMKTDSAAREKTLLDYKNKNLLNEMNQNKIANNHDVIFVKNDVSQIDAVLNTPVYIDGFSDIYLENYLDKQQTYTIRSNLCLEGKVLSHCYFTIDTIQLDPNGFVSMGRNPTLATDTNDEGTFTVHLQTSVEKADSSTVFATMAANTLTVHS